MVVEVMTVCLIGLAVLIWGAFRLLRGLVLKQPALAGRPSVLFPCSGPFLQYAESLFPGHANVCDC